MLNELSLRLWVTHDRTRQPQTTSPTIGFQKILTKLKPNEYHHFFFFLTRQIGPCAGRLMHAHTPYDRPAVQMVRA